MGANLMKSQNYDYKLIGFNIRKARKAAGYTQEYLANAIDVGTKHISNLECGLAGISVDVLIKLCETLGISADYILFGEITTDMNSPFNRMLSKLNKRQIAQAEKILDAFVKSCVD